MMKCFFLFFLCVSAHCQNIKILNSTTKEPVPYVTAVFYEGEEQKGGDYANERGELTIPSTCNSVVLSCIGYKTRVFAFITDLSEVFLDEIPFELKEIIITDKNTTEIIGFINKKRALWAVVERFTKTAVYIENPYNNPVTIKSFLFKPYKIKGKRMYRIHLYRKSATGDEPGDDLLPKDIVRFVEKGDKDIVEIDLSEYGVLMPKEGIYAAIEGLGAFDYEGSIVTNQYDTGFSFESFQTSDNIHFHQPIFFKGKGWIKMNKWLSDEDRRRGIKTDKKSLGAPSFGLKVFIP